MIIAPPIQVKKLSNQGEKKLQVNNKVLSGYLTGLKDNKIRITLLVFYLHQTGDEYIRKFT